MIRNKQTISNRHAFESLSSTGYLVVHKRLLQTYGPEAAIFIANLIDKYLLGTTNEKRYGGIGNNRRNHQLPGGVCNGSKDRGKLCNLSLQKKY